MKRALLFFLLFQFIYIPFYSIEIVKNEPRYFLSTTNDRFSFGITQNKDDQYTASTEFHLFFPYFFCDLEVNSYTNRGYKSDLSDSSTFSKGRYDELFFRTGTKINLLKTQFSTIDVIPSLGFDYLGNLLFEDIQNIYHKMKKIPPVSLGYDKFSHPIAPVLDFCFNYSVNYFPFITNLVTFETDDNIFYSSNKKLKISTIIGKDKTLFDFYCGYNWNNLFCNSTTFTLAQNVTNGTNIGFCLDTGFYKFDYTGYLSYLYGTGTLSFDFLCLKKHNWDKTDIILSSGLSYIFSTEYLINTIELPSDNNFSFFLSSKYVSGFKINSVNPDLPYRTERDYEINEIGFRYRIPCINWISPYIELGTGIATFRIQKLYNHIPDSPYYSKDLGTKNFWEIESCIGIDLIPEGLLVLGSASYQFTFFAGTTYIPDFKKASQYIKKDNYRKENWELTPFSFTYGFAITFGLDF